MNSIRIMQTQPLLIEIVSPNGDVSLRPYPTTLDRVIASWDPFQHGADTLHGDDCSGCLELAHVLAMLDGTPYRGIAGTHQLAA